MMKMRWKCVVTAATAMMLIAGMLAGCNKEELQLGTVSAYEIAMHTKQSQSFFAENVYDELSYNDAEERELFLNLYAIEEYEECVSDVYAFVSATDLADEIAVVITTRNTEVIAKAMEARMEERIRIFEGYEPAEVAKIKKGSITVYGEYVVFLICQEQSAAEAAAKEAVSYEYQAQYEMPTPVENGTTPVVSVSPSTTDTPTVVPTVTEAVLPTQGITDEMTPTPTTEVESSVYGEGYEYGYPPVLIEAIRENDASLLKENRDVELFYRCRELLDKWISDEMTLYEKERAIFTMLVAELKYDKAHYSIAGEAPNSVNPYGALVDGKAICTGYANSFQLFMTVLGIPCINVEGSAFEDYEPHCWNMVQLEEQWYYVDVCWGDSGRDSGGNYKYLNTTTSYMISTTHHWDSNAYPYVEKYYYESEYYIR